MQGNSSFQEYLDHLNPEQYQAVTTIEGPVLVLAGPGTGKTQVLTLRIAQILTQTDTLPHSILALTFTEAAAQEMKQRLARIIGPTAYQVPIHTFHGFCNEILHRYNRLFSHYIDAKAITELEQIHLIEEILSGGSFREIRPIARPQAYISDIRSAIQDLKKERITPEQLSNAIDQHKESFDQIEDRYHEKGRYKGQMKAMYKKEANQILRNCELLQLYTTYQSTLHERHLYDFNDMLLTVSTELETNEELRQELQEQYQYILVDEHQDTNTAQNTIIEQIAGYFEQPNLFVVGDEKQAIFRFQGATLENFLYFQNRFPDATIISLQQNYRSTQTIVDASITLIQQNPASSFVMSESLALQSQKRDQVAPIDLLRCPTPHDEEHAIATRIQSLLNNGVPASEIAIITRYNHDAITMGDVLGRHDIPYRLSTDISILSDSIIQQIIGILQAIDQFPSDAHLAPILFYAPFQIHPVDAALCIESARASKRSIIEELLQLADNEKTASQQQYRNPVQLQHFADSICRWKTVSENESLDQLFVAVIHQSGFLTHVLAQPNAETITERVIRLYDELKNQLQLNPHLRLDAFLQYLEQLEDHGISLQAPFRRSQDDTIPIMTAHRSKGLEFAYVFLPRSVDGRWGNARTRAAKFKLPWDFMKPHYLEQAEVDTNEDERRLYFVAMTRAKDQIIISHAQQDHQGKELSPSQFVLEIDSHHLSPTQVSAQPAIDQATKLFQTPPSPSEEITRTALQAYLRMLLERNGISPTGLNTYLRCPWQFVFRSLIRLPEVQKPQQAFGTAIHSALHRFFTSPYDNRITKDQLIGCFDSVLEQTLHDHSNHDQLREKGHLLLERYYTETLLPFPKQTRSEVSLSTHLDNEILIKGKIDAMIKTDSQEIIVYDFKTGKPKTQGQIEGTTKDSTGDYWRQMIFYSLLIEQTYDHHQQMSEGVIAFLEPDSRNQLVEHPIRATIDERSHLKDQIRSCASAIQSLSFWDQSCEDPDCDACRLRNSITDGIADQ